MRMYKGSTKWGYPWWNLTTKIYGKKVQSHRFVLILSVTDLMLWEKSHITVT